MKTYPPLEEFDLYEDYPFEDDISSPMELAFREASSAVDEDTEPETEEEAELSKVPFTQIEELTSVFFALRAGCILADRVLLLRDVWYDFENDCPHLTFGLKYPLKDPSISTELLESIRTEVEDLGDVLAPLFGKQIAISVDLLTAGSAAKTRPV